MSTEKLEQAMDYIRRSPSVRTPELVTLLRMPAFEIDALLAGPREQGLLITCDVEVGDGQHVTEYRCSTIGGATHTYRPPNRPVRRATPARPGATTKPLASEIRVSAPAPADAEPEREEPQVSMTKRFNAVHAAFKQHGPMTKRRLEELSGIKDAIDVLRHGELTQDFKRLGGKTSGTIWGVLGQQLPKDGNNPPRAIHRKKVAKHAKKRAGGGSVAVRRKPPVKRAKKAFRPALAADGAILFLGAHRGDFEIGGSDARVVVDLVRRLTGDELVQAVDFIERLDNAEVCA